MTDKKFSEFPDGAAFSHTTDRLVGTRAGDNVIVGLGSMAEEDSVDYYVKTEVDDAVAVAPPVVNLTGNTTLSDALHNGAEIHLQPHTGSPSIYTVTLPYNLPTNFRCSFINECAAGEVRIACATGSPNDTLNGVASGVATFLLQYTGAYLRKTATGKLVLVGGAISVS